MATQEVLNNPINIEILVNNLIKENQLQSAIDLYLKAYEYSKNKNGVLHPNTTAYVNKYSRLLSTYNIETIDLKNMKDEIKHALENYDLEENINIMKN